MSTELKIDLDPGSIIVAFADKVYSTCTGVLSAIFVWPEPAGRSYVLAAEIGTILIEFSFTLPQLKRLKDWASARIRESEQYTEFEEVQPGPA